MNFWWSFGISKAKRDEAERILARLSERARDPQLYLAGGVPDTLDGRFQLLGLFTALEMQRIEDAKLRQAVFDRLFITCEAGLREMGIGDLSVPHKLKAMMKAFHGHALAYQAASRGEGGWDEALTRNVYGTVETPPTAEQLAVLKDAIAAFTADAKAAA